MKTRPLPLAIGMLAITALAPLQAEPTAAQRANSAYLDAVAYETAGNVAKAKNSYMEALRFNPKHHKARYRLGQLKINGAQIVAQAQERKIAGVMIPEYRVNEAEFGDAVKALGMLIEKESKDEIIPNFIIQDPKNNLAQRKVNLRMRNAPSGEILKHMLQMVNAKVRYDQHAVVITPL